MKRKAINILIGLAILLLVTNIIIELFEKDEEEKMVSRDIPVTVVDSIFNTVLDEYALEESWIVKKKLYKNVYDSVDHYYEVKLPHDVPVPYIVRDVQSKIAYPFTQVVSEELKSYGNTNLKIFSDEVLKLLVKFEYDKNIQRPYAEISFVIDNAEDMSDEEFTQFINQSFPFAVGLIPSKENLSKKNLIKEYDKEYVVIINDMIEDSKFRLSPKLSKKFLSESVGEITSEFKDAAFYIVDERSELYRSAVFNLIRDKFRQRGVRLKTRSSCTSITTTDKKEMASLLKFYCTSGRSKQGKKILISGAGFESLAKEIEIAKKKGHKFVLPSQIKNR